MFVQIFLRIQTQVLTNTMSQRNLLQFFGKKRKSDSKEATAEEPPGKVTLTPLKPGIDSTDPPIDNKAKIKTGKTGPSCSTTHQSATGNSPFGVFQKSQTTTVSSQTKYLQSLFPGKKIHHHDICDPECTSLSSEEKERLNKSEKRKRDKLFKHSWLTTKELSYCSGSGYWWAVYVEGEGAYCFLCRKHEGYSTANKSYTFSSTPSVRFRSETLSDHATSRTHAEIVSLDITQRNSVFEKEVQEKQLSENKVIECVMRNLYFVMKEEISIVKAAKLNNLLQIQGVEEMRHFQHRSVRIRNEMILVLGEAVVNTYLNDLKENDKYYGLLVDDLTDIAVKEQMVCFVQYLGKHGSKEVKFLFLTDLLKDESSSADAQTIKAAIYQGLEDKGLKNERFVALCTDGAPVMVGEKKGLAGLLRQDNPAILTFHCVCHKLALATTDACSENSMKYINDVHDLLRQTWQMFEKSPKKTAVFLKTQANVNTAVLSERIKKRAVHKLKKACKTRWLSFEQSVASAKQSLYALLVTLKELESDSAVASGLYKKMYCAKFLAAIYLLSEVLPILSALSKTFQQGSLCYAHINGSINYAKHELNQLLSEDKKDKFLDELQTELSSGCLSETTLQLSEGVKSAILTLKTKYIKSLITNIDSRFAKCQNVFEAFKIFDPEAIPGKESKEFAVYGSKQIDLLGRHFFKDADRP